ncbi:MAG: inosine/xanthosine triphosphatase [Patescibacteria group bacterium]
MKTIVVASTNPVKISVVSKAIAAVLPNETFDVVSSDLEKSGAEPFGRGESLEQVRTAIREAKKLHPGADYYIAMEGGVEINGTEIDEVAYVIAEDSSKNESISHAASFSVPHDIALEVRKGVPFSEAVEQFFKVKDVKQGGGFVKILTGGLIDKEALYMQPTIIALSKLQHKDWY